MMNKTIPITVCMALLFTMIMGCGGSDRPSTVKVTGTVKLNGQPVANATVAFIGDGHAATAVSRDDGTFTLTTFEDGDGAVEGDYRATVVKMTGGGISGAPANDSMEAAAEAAEANNNPDSDGPKSSLPQRYSDPNTSGFQFTVKSGEENDFTLELTP